MSTTDPSRAGRTDRPGGGMPKPATPMVAVVVAAVAGLLGLLILKDVKDDGASGTPDNNSSRTTTTKVGATTTLPGGATTTSSIVIRQGATVVVANASGQDGVAGALTTALKNRGYSTGAAVTGTTRRDTTQIMVKEGDAAAAAVAKSILLEMNLTGPTVALPAEPPTEDPIGSGTTILILLGKDKAGQPLKALGSSTVTTAASSATTDEETETTD